MEEKRKLPRIYLAGPMVFYPEPLEIFDVMKRICSAYGLEGFAPLDNQIGLEGVIPGKPLVLKIVQADFDLMDRLDGALFCLDPFRRSTEMDPGTAVEIGYMKALKKPMAGWTTHGMVYPEKVVAHFKDIYGQDLVQTAPNDCGGTSGILRDPDGILVHSEGMVQNGMTQGAIELSGGAVFADKRWETAFAQAAESVASQFKNLAAKPVEDCVKRQEKVKHEIA